MPQHSHFPPTPNESDLFRSEGCLSLVLATSHGTPRVGPNQTPCLLGFDKRLGVVCSAPTPLTRLNRQCPSLFTTTSLWVWGISDLMPSFPRSVQRAPSNCYCHSILDRKSAWPVLATTWHCDLSQQMRGLLMMWGHLCIRKPKQNISPSRSRQRGSSQAPPPPEFFSPALCWSTRILRGFSPPSTRIFGTPCDADFWNATTRNLARNFGRGFFGALWPIIFSISGPKNPTPKISAQISCFFTAIFWPILPAKSGAGTEPNEEQI